MAYSTHCSLKNCLNKFGRKILSKQTNKFEEPSGKGSRNANGFSTRCERVDLIYLSQDKIHWGLVMKVISQQAEHLLTTSKHLCKKETFLKREKYIRI